MITDGTSEESISHIGDDGGSSNNEAFNSHNLVDIYILLVDFKDERIEIPTRRI